jgi:hypothetical protein
VAKEEKIRMSFFYVEGGNKLTKKEIHGTIGCPLKAESLSRPSVMITC